MTSASRSALAGGAASQAIASAAPVARRSGSWIDADDAGAGALEEASDQEADDAEPEDDDAVAERCLGVPDDVDRGLDVGGEGQPRPR